MTQRFDSCWRRKRAVVRLARNTRMTNDESTLTEDSPDAYPPVQRHSDSADPDWYVRRYIKQLDISQSDTTGDKLCPDGESTHADPSSPLLQEEAALAAISSLLVMPGTISASASAAKSPPWSWPETPRAPTSPRPPTQAVKKAPGPVAPAVFGWWPSSTPRPFGGEDHPSTSSRILPPLTTSPKPTVTSTLGQNAGLYPSPPAVPSMKTLPPRKQMEGGCLSAGGIAQKGRPKQKRQATREVGRTSIQPATGYSLRTERRLSQLSEAIMWTGDTIHETTDPLFLRPHHRHQQSASERAPADLATRTPVSTGAAGGSGLGESAGVSPAIKAPAKKRVTWSKSLPRRSGYASCSFHPSDFANTSSPNRRRGGGRHASARFTERRQGICLRNEPSLGLLNSLSNRSHFGLKSDSHFPIRSTISLASLFAVNTL